MRLRSFSALLVCASVLSACSDGPTPPPTVGPLTQLAVRSGDDQSAPAARPLTSPIVIVPQDAAGRTVVNQTATFAVTAGGGSLSSTTGQTNSDGSITAPTWTLGKFDVPQELTVDVAGRTLVVGASVTTGYVVNVRFFGGPIAPEQQTAFTTAAARVRGFIVGAVPPENMAGARMDSADTGNGEMVPFCTGPGSPPLNETVNGLLIFASAQSIDGPNGTLAQAGPCYIRSSTDFRTVVGVMQFDSDDLQTLTPNQLLDVITHEMLHVVGLGAFWDPPPQGKNLITGSGAPGAGYIGAAGLAGCRAVGGTVVCANSVPIEDCVGETNCGGGSRESHWKEGTFDRELMTSFLNNGPPNPLSLMTIRSFEDLGYVVNTAPADNYTVFLPGFTAPSGGASSIMFSRNWERPLPFRPRPVRPGGWKLEREP
ncbi:MAG TPA: hypothetical protein VNO75_10160 [Gemmatimonadaceae bacterium]|nr:hypothetical protein [Gemmatimonadaceae bacterium]